MNQDTKRYLETRHRIMWKQLFTEGLDTHTSEAVKTEILNGQTKHPVEPTSESFSTWVCSAMDRLDALVQDKDTRRKIMQGCSSRIPVARLELLQEVYQQTGNLDCLIEFINHDTAWRNPDYSEYLVRDGNRLFVTKTHQNPKDCDTADYNADLPALSCHCPHIQPAIRAQKSISPSFCLCGSGWYKHLWEAILEHPVRVEMLETGASGAAYCRFVIHLLEEPSQSQCASDCIFEIRSQNPNIE